ncbi:MAG: O-methyltransferase [Cyclobacteriaceae bacterium]|nr:O-methyltransferase [Cyclobacteriaceae bacterium SS2]
MSLIPEPLQKYSEDHTSEESALLTRINRETHLHELRPRMLSGHLQGRYLSMLSKMIQPKYILEIGTYTGYSALCLAEGLQKDGKLITLEKNEELKGKISAYLDQSNYKDQIEVKIGEAASILPTLNYTWDMIFIDADKENYPVYYDMTLDNLRSGGLLLADNVLWSGKVYDPQQQDKVTNTIRSFNEMVLNDPRVENILLPIRDGIMMARKK